MKPLHFLFCALLMCGTSSILFAQKSFPKSGIADQKSITYAFTNATIYSRYDKKIENATLLVRDGKVEAVGQNISLPPDAIVQSVQGKVIYPAFIDLYSNYGLPDPKAVGTRPKTQPQMLSNNKGAYSWNEALKPEFTAAEHFKVDDKKAALLRKAGFGAVMTHQMDGISRGKSAFVLLGKERAHEMLLSTASAHHMAFRKGKSTQNYPSSLMGIIALLRQTYLDGNWYKEQSEREETNLSLEAWNEVLSLPQIMEVRNHLEVHRAVRLGTEFQQSYILKGEGDEYKSIDQLPTKKVAFILPLTFPNAYDLSDPFEASGVSLRKLQHWEMAPSNPARLAAADIPFALTSQGLKKATDFLPKLRKAIEAGLPEETALKALTQQPAEMVRMSDRIGSLEKGKLANFLICSAPLSDKNFVIHQNWIKGHLYELEPMHELPAEGKYRLDMPNQGFDLLLRHKKNKASISLQLNDSIELPVKSSLNKANLSLYFSPSKEDKNFIRLAGSIQASGNWSGSGSLGDGSWVDWTAKRSGDLSPKETKDKSKKTEATSLVDKNISHPFGAYGWTERPKANTYLIQNATVWTNEEDGILTNTDVLIRDGKIAQIGQQLSPNGATVINAEGKHLTAGIIDEHSHIAISRGVNEGTQVSSAEVRIGDVIDPEDINIYRQLAGGVTTSQLLHGSANPIGGQSAIIKLRWGYPAEAMKFEGADGFIKFALGENVKQSNWGDNWTIRFPQTRMGVEQVFEDYFTRAREYAKLRASNSKYRRDLDLEAVLEILQSKRFITCHSYQQGEINMLMKVAERHGFRVNTFTHVLEGYKVADKMVQHQAGGSTFSDWWAYKYEVIDAIPHNGALMHEQGVLTAFNSDDAEMGRRLNQEAAKAVQHGNVSEEDALKFVTLHPAKLLHIDQRVGSIKVGKDADIVLWSEHPLSVYSKAEKTFIDGIIFFDRDTDKLLQAQNQKERARLVQKSLEAKEGGAPTQQAKSKYRHLYHCDHMQDEAR